MIKHCYKILSFLIKHYINVILKHKHKLSCFIIILMITIVIEYTMFYKCNNINIKNIYFNYKLITLLNTVIDK